MSPSWSCRSRTRRLALLWSASASDTSARSDLQTWQREVKSRLPAGSTFRARAFHFAYTDAKKIRKKLLSECRYAEDTSQGVEFVMAIKVFAFHGGICSVWVYYGLIDTDLAN